MNKQNLVAAVVFVGLCTVLLGAPGEPNPALKSVAHDATLLGDGTTNAPLGVANPSNSVRIVDSRGQLVGPFIGLGMGSTNETVRRIGENVFIIPVGPNGFQSSFQVEFLHTTSD